MTDFKAEMRPIRFSPRLLPRPCWGSLQGSSKSKPLAVGLFKWPTSEMREGQEREWEGEGKER